MKKSFFSRIFLGLACVGLLSLPAHAAEMTVSGAAAAPHPLRVLHLEGENHAKSQ